MKYQHPSSKTLETTDSKSCYSAPSSHKDCTLQVVPRVWGCILDTGPDKDFCRTRVTRLSELGIVVIVAEFNVPLK